MPPYGMEQDMMKKTEEEWREELGPERYEVLRKKGTERAGTGALLHETRKGTYVCGACGAELFSSDAKFDSGSGWPSFTDPMFAAAITTATDESYGMRRTEIMCARCGGHLGHVFDDGPGKSGKRYCVNSLSLDLMPKDGSIKDV
jgi:peptide-methionine (R)-S-oxide reductase